MSITLDNEALKKYFKEVVSINEFSIILHSLLKGIRIETKIVGYRGKVLYKIIFHKPYADTFLFMKINNLVEIYPKMLLSSIRMKTDTTLTPENEKLYLDRYYTRPEYLYT